MLRLVSEVPLQEDTLMRVMIIGLTKELGVSAADALELADQLIRRAAMLHTEGACHVIFLQNIARIVHEFNLFQYH